MAQTVSIAENIKERLQKIKLLILDIDGVLTDGHIIYGDHGDEIKSFDVQDGFGVALLAQAGIKTVLVSARKSRINERRGKEIKAAKVYQRVDSKLKIYQKILKKFKLKNEEICFVGDDLIDIPLLLRAGLAVAVQNAAEEVKEKAHWVTEKSGGRGAVREISDLILKTQNKWEEVTRKYYE